MHSLSDSIPDFGFHQGPMVQETPPHPLSRIIVPTGGIDQKFNQEVADILMLSFQNPHDHQRLSFVLNDLYNQMASVYVPSSFEYMRMLQGDATQPDRVPGMPVWSHIEHYLEAISPQKLYDLVMLFRHHAILFHTQMGMFDYILNRYELIYQKYITGGWVFLMAPRTYPVL